MSLILASKSMARQNMLKQCGLEFESIPADVDEENIIADLGMQKTDVQNIAKKLSYEKAYKISTQHNQQYVIGSDQILTLGDAVFQKAKTLNDAKEKLKTLRGKTHYLHSAYCLMKGEKVIDEYCDSVALTMHNFDDSFLDNYVNAAGDNVMQCVGGYAIEDIGITLFEKIEGDYFTILGMPLLPLLSTLRNESVIA